MEDVLVEAGLIFTLASATLLATLLMGGDEAVGALKLTAIEFTAKFGNRVTL
jgi:hypothetical protein